MKDLIPYWFRSQTVTGMLGGLFVMIIGLSFFKEPGEIMAWIGGAMLAFVVAFMLPRLHKILMGGG